MPTTPAKLALLNRAVPGSGKTTISRCIHAAMTARGLGVTVHSADDFFLSPARTYDFDPKLLAAHHARCLAEFRASLAAGTPLVVCDNTNLSPWQAEPYSTAARAAGYRVVLLDFAPRALADHVRAQAVTPERPDAHGVPERTLREMIAEYHEQGKFLDPAYVPDPALDRRPRWNPATLSVELTGEVLRPYDADEVLHVLPDQYVQAQVDVPARLLALMNDDDSWGGRGSPPSRNALPRAASGADAMSDSSPTGTLPTPAASAARTS